MAGKEGNIYSVDGPVISAVNLDYASVGEQVLVGELELIGEIIEFESKFAVIQVYEDTTGLKPGMKVQALDHPLSVELGPGLLKNTFDGIQRPLKDLANKSGDFIKRGEKINSLDREQKWHFVPLMKKGDKVTRNSRLGKVRETEIIDHFILPSSDVTGELTDIATEGDYTIEDNIATIQNENGENIPVNMLQRCGVRSPRPYLERKETNVPLITGQRIIDFLFPIAKGGVACIPGGFGTGKTVTQHQLAKWADANIIIYIGCGERGNEMTQVLEEFPKLEDPKSGKPLIERTVLIANTSNMPVSAREASIYTGITIGEYYRDMGYDVAVMADSTSRWAEALREISSRLEEMPAERGFPAYLSSRLAEFYERGGMVKVSDKHAGSVTIIGAVSPPGGDFSEPVTQHTKKVTKTFWALDKDLASQRHFPAIDWNNSYSGYTSNINQWLKNNKGEIDWVELKNRTNKILNENNKLQRVVKLVGPDALPDSQRLTYEFAKIIKEAFLQQNAFSDVDSFCSMEKQAKLMEIILKFYSIGEDLIKLGVPVMKIINLDITDTIKRLKNNIPNDKLDEFDKIKKKLEKRTNELAEDYK